MFYVYAYLRESDNTPYYIGKGKNSRIHGKHNVSVPNNKSKIVFLETNLSEIGALALERRYIKWYGRKDLGTGILRNRTDGGEGSSGRIVSEESKIKQVHTRRSNGNYVVSKETKDKISNSLAGFGQGVAKSKSHIENITKAKQGNKNPMFGKIPTQDHKKKISIAMIGIEKEKIKCPYCNKEGGKPAMIRFHFNNCKIKEA